MASLTLMWLNSELNPCPANRGCHRDQYYFISFFFPSFNVITESPVLQKHLLLPSMCVLTINTLCSFERMASMPRKYIEI